MLTGKDSGERANPGKSSHHVSLLGRFITRPREKTSETRR
jgi:hypothetical protein